MREREIGERVREQKDKHFSCFSSIIPHKTVVQSKKKRDSAVSLKEMLIKRQKFKNETLQKLI